MKWRQRGRELWRFYSWTNVLIHATIQITILPCDTDQVGLAIKPRTNIREVVGLNFCREVSSPDCCLTWLSSAPRGKHRCSMHFIIHLLSYHPLIRRCMVPILTASLNKQLKYVIYDKLFGGLGLTSSIIT
jgi:hypothetical protein